MSRYNLRPRTSAGLPGARPSGGDGPSEPNSNTAIGILERRTSFRGQSTQVEPGSRRNSRASGSTRSSGSTMSSRGSNNSTRNDLNNNQGISSTPDTSTPPVYREQQKRPGVPRQKHRWTPEMNRYLMKEYYKITSNKDKASSYSKELRRHFLTKFPHMESVSVHRIMHQKQSICRKNIIPQELLDEIRLEAQSELAMCSQESKDQSTVHEADDGNNKSNNNNDNHNSDVSVCSERNASNRKSNDIIVNNDEDPDDDNEELPKLNEENQFTLKQELAKYREKE